MIFYLKFTVMLLADEIVLILENFRWILDTLKFWMTHQLVYVSFVYFIVTSVN